jgi:IclR family pca regulon transcriptional regulator
MLLDKDDADFVSALARGLNVIRCFGPGAEALSLAEVAKKVGLSRATARRLLLTLQSLGYVQHDGKSFRLTSRTLSLGYAYLSSVPIWKAAQPFMTQVVEELDECCSLGLLDEHEIVYLVRMPPKHQSYFPVSPGTRMPAHKTTMGLALLAQFSNLELDQHFETAYAKNPPVIAKDDEQSIRKAIKTVSRDGYATNDRQYYPGVRSIAVSIRSPSGRPEVAINVSAEESRISKADLVRKCLPVLQRAARQFDWSSD